MTRLAWATDLHLDHIRGGDEFVAAFIASVKRDDVDSYVITGDISTSVKLPTHLHMLEELGKPVYFVLGNHDLWYSSAHKVRKRCSSHEFNANGLTYLSRGGVHELTPACALVGQDGWYDGLNGSGGESRFILNDWKLIQDYSTSCSWQGYPKDMDRVLQVSQRLALEAVQRLEPDLRSAASNYPEVVVATHIPPWEKAHFHEGVIGDPDAHPWYTSRLMGNFLEKVADDFPGVQFTVLAGHTHGACDVKIAHNLRCKVGGSDYGAPRIHEVLEL
jgi:predicted phosphohydrolase